MSIKPTEDISKSLEAAQSKPHGIEVDDKYIVIPLGCVVESLEGFKDAPDRVIADIELLSPESFVQYINKFKSDSTFITGKPTADKMFYATLDYHEKNKPSWCKHHITLLAEKTEAWGIWTKDDGKRMPQKQFLMFLEDNISDIDFAFDSMTPYEGDDEDGQPEYEARVEHAQLLNAVSNINIKGKSSVKSKVGDTSHDVSVTQSINLDSGLPRKIMLNMEPFMFSGRWQFEARLFAYIKEGEPPTFQYQIIRKEKILQSVFESHIKKIEDSTSIKVLV